MASPRHSTPIPTFSSRKRRRGDRAKWRRKRSRDIQSRFRFAGVNFSSERVLWNLECNGMDEDMTKNYDMQLIGTFLHCASRGDRIALNQMLRNGTSPNVQDYDKRTALHLAASEDHASIVELLIQYNVNVNPKDRWQRTPLTDARLYGHRDICRILEVNGANDSTNDPYLTIRHEHSSLNEVNIDPSELNLERSSTIKQGEFGESEKVKWRGTWVVKTIIKTEKTFPEIKTWSSKELSCPREHRHPNILQFL